MTHLYRFFALVALIGALGFQFGLAVGAVVKASAWTVARTAFGFGLIFSTAVVW